MSDIVKRLRAPTYWISGSSEGHEGDNSAPLEAADEIEKLRRRVEWHTHALHSCHDECDRPTCVRFREINSEVDRLRAALERIADERLASSDMPNYMRGIARAALEEST